MSEPYILKKGLSLDRLKTLRDVAAAGGIRNAVGDDPVRQSLASRQLKELDACFGVRLTARKGRTISVTPEGQELARIVEDFFVMLTRYEDGITNRSSSMSLGIGDSYFQWYLLPCLPAIQRAYPKMNLVPQSNGTEEIVQGVRGGRFDLGVVRSTSVSGKMLVSCQLGTVRYKLFIPSQLYNSLPKVIDFKEVIKDLPFCTLSGSGEYATFVDSLLEKCGAAPPLKCASLLQVSGTVQSGQYAAILPEGARVTLTPDRFIEIPLSQLKGLERKLIVIWRSQAIRKNSSYEEFAKYLALTMSDYMKSNFGD